MGLLGKVFSRKVGEVKDSANKAINRDLLQAVIAGAMLVASADGNVDSKEITTLERIISTTPQLSHFGGEIQRLIGQFKAAMESSFRQGRIQCMREMDDIKSDVRNVEDVMSIVISIAEASGSIEELEMKVLEEIAARLGTSLREFGFE